MRARSTLRNLTIACIGPVGNCYTDILLKISFDHVIKYQLFLNFSVSYRKFCPLSVTFFLVRKLRIVITNRLNFFSFTGTINAASIGLFIFIRKHTSLPENYIIVSLSTSFRRKRFHRNTVFTFTHNFRVI